MKKVVKLVIVVFIVTLLIYVIKGNIRLEKENVISENKSDVLELESSIVSSLVDNIRFDEVNNTCNYKSGKCYVNNNYLYMYYKERQGNMGIDELMYLEFTNYYKDNNYVIEGDYIKIDSEKFNRDFKNKYGLDVEPNLYKGNDYVYTGEYYEFKNEEKDIDRKVISKLYRAVKEEDYIHLYVESFYDDDKDNVYKNDFIFKLSNDEYILFKVEKV